MLSITPYIDVGDAETYFQTRLDTDPWDNADNAKRTIALSQSTRAIEQLDFYGVKTSSTQELAFPRNGETTIPDDIKIACCENALALLDGIDIESEIRSLVVTNSSFAGTRTAYDRSFVLEHLRAGIASGTAWRHLLPYLNDPYEMKLTRV